MTAIIETLTNGAVSKSTKRVWKRRAAITTAAIVKANTRRLYSWLSIRVAMRRAERRARAGAPPRRRFGCAGRVVHMFAGRERGVGLGCIEA